MHRLLLVLSLATVSLSCRHEPPQRSHSQALSQRAEAVRRSIQELSPVLTALNGKLTALHAEFDPLPPGLPGFGETRARFYAVSIGLGTLGSKLPWLSSRVDAAIASGSGAELQAVVEDVAQTQAQAREAERATAELLQQVQPFKQRAAERMDQLQAFGQTTCQ